MRVLFISSGNSDFGISPIVKNQGDSLHELSVEISYFTINGKGIFGYLLNLKRLRNVIVAGKYDILHAHYSLSAFLTSLTFSHVPVVASLMGSDAYLSFPLRILTRMCARFVWKRVILKSENMNNCLFLNEYLVLPNGVDLRRFKTLDKQESCSMVGYDINTINVTFLADPKRPEKNFKLCNAAILIAADKCAFNFHVINNISPDLVPVYLNATDVLILTSQWEGSPNIIKEAMSCNTCVVSTKVGDVEWLFGDEEGYFMANSEAPDIADILVKAITSLSPEKKTHGRCRIKELGLDSESTATILLKLYNSVLQCES